MTFVVGSSLADFMGLHRRRRLPASSADERATVIVGVDGLPGALKAVTWATIEAEHRRVPLRLVYAIDPSDCATTGGTPRNAGQYSEVLEAAAVQARSVSGSVEVVREIVHAPPSVALARDNAVMICLGSNGAHPPHPGHRLGVTTEVLLTADCPVTIVRGEPLVDGSVVAQLGNDPAAADLLRASVEESVLRRMPLRLLTNWTEREGTLAGSPAELDARLARELDKWVSRHPGLDVGVERNLTLEQYLHDHRDQIALFVATDPQSQDIGTVLHPNTEHALRVLPCPVMLHAGSRPAGTRGRRTRDLRLLRLGQTVITSRRDDRTK